MTLMTEDGKMSVSIGSSTILHALYSTTKVHMGIGRLRVRSAMAFLESGVCKKGNIGTTLEQLKLVKLKLAEIEPARMVYDYKNRNMKAPWQHVMSDEITSCADLFTTSEGRLLIDELLLLLEYAHENELSIVWP